MKNKTNLILSSLYLVYQIKCEVNEDHRGVNERV